MSDEILATEGEPVALSSDVQTIVDAELAKAKENYENQMRGLNRSVSNLQKELAEKNAAGKSIEERTADIERELQSARARAATMEAFGRKGLTEDWRSLFDIKDPEARADALAGLLEDHTKSIQKQIATQFVRDPEQSPGDNNGPRMYTPEQLKGMKPDEINKIWNEGRVKAS